MKKAIEDVRAGYSIRRAAADYGIPKSTLADRISGRVIDGTPAKYLSDAEEAELVKFIVVNWISKDTSKYFVSCTAHNGFTI